VLDSAEVRWVRGEFRLQLPSSSVRLLAVMELAARVGAPESGRLALLACSALGPAPDRRRLRRPAAATPVAGAPARHPSQAEDRLGGRRPAAQLDDLRGGDGGEGCADAQRQAE